MNNAFTTEEIAILKAKGWEAGVSDDVMVCGFHRLTKYSGLFGCSTWMDDGDMVSGGYWDQDCINSDIHSVPSFSR